MRIIYCGYVVQQLVVRHVVYDKSTINRRGTRSLRLAARFCRQEAALRAVPVHRVGRGQDPSVGQRRRDD